MPLYDITNKVDKVEPNKAANYAALVKLKNSLHTATFDRVIKTVDEAITSCRPSESSALVWTRSAALFGESSKQPHKHISHLWENVEAVVGRGKYTLKAVGGLLRWRISLQPDTWLVFRRDSDDLDLETGKLITISEYWINNDFMVVSRPSLKDLANSWGARITEARR